MDYCCQTFKLVRTSPVLVKENKTQRQEQVPDCRQMLYMCTNLIVLQETPCCEKISHLTGCSHNVFRASATMRKFLTRQFISKQNKTLQPRQCSFIATFCISGALLISEFLRFTQRSEFFPFLSFKDIRAELWLPSSL